RATSSSPARRVSANAPTKLKVKFLLAFQSRYQSSSKATSSAVTWGPSAPGLSSPNLYRRRPVPPDSLRARELVQQKHGPDGLARGQVEAHLVGDQVGVGHEIFARDLALPPAAPVV